MILLKSPTDLTVFLDELRKGNNKIGFVATMGALHDGHLSLIERSRKENDTTVCSIFVNPRQFNDSNDLEKYPRPIENDIIKLTESKTDILFAPSYSDIYPEDYHEPIINLDEFDNTLEGLIRPGHFKGVALVVKRLFECVKPDRAYFGQKDFQQTLIIKHLVSLYKFPIEIIICEILREKNGLAMSSRNVRLTEEQRKNAGFIYKSLLELRENSKIMSLADAISIAEMNILKNEGAKIEYLTVVEPATLKKINNLSPGKLAMALIVVNYFGVRLLDNLFL